MGGISARDCFAAVDPAAAAMDWPLPFRLKPKLPATSHLAILAPNATRNARIRLGLIINNAIIAKRNADTRALAEVMAPHCVASVVREPTHELDAVHVALLAEITRQDDLEQTLSDLASDWEGRIEIRLLGPMAPYDFTTLLPQR